jgi:hypothetical protein
MTDINEWSRITDPDGNQLYGVYLYKTEFTIPVGETTLSFGPANGIVGTVVACWLDPTTLTAAATIKAYQVEDDLVTLGPDYFIDYTVPNPAVETRSLRAKRMFVVGNIVIDIAGATAGDTGVIYVFVSTSADAEQASIDIGDVTLLPGTALIGKVGLENSLVAVPAVIADDASLSAEIDLGAGRILCGADMPDGWTAANLTFQASYNTGGTFDNLYDQSGGEKTIVVAASRYIALDDPAFWMGVRYIKVRSGTAGTPVVQDRAGGTTIQLVTKPV